MRAPSALWLLGLPWGVTAQTLPEQVVERVNQARWEHGGLPPLKADARLAAAAQSHSEAMATRDFLMHCDPDTRLGFAYRVGATGYSPALATENLAAGPSSAAAVMMRWMDNAGQRFNILADYRDIGVGYQLDPNDYGLKRSASSATSCRADVQLDGRFGHYWTQVFGLQYGVYPLVIAREAWQTGTCAVDLYLYAPNGTAEMRFSNDAGATWSAWQPYAAQSVWSVSGGAGGSAIVAAQTRDDSGQVLDATDSIRLALDCPGATPRSIFLSGFD